MKPLIRTLFSVMAAALLANCASGFIPTVEHPTPDQWCFAWVIFGYPARACFGTEAEMRAAKFKAIALAQQQQQQDAGL